ncbi:hypothetical protein JKF63_00486 [Porcisia hertigi]|uniref:Uncharacterized protein n=1 Tax=Porcisia hertigi TaxID=2761500 RepID=A0A836HBQ3_9TRYP|nr:hypothetical protein JKF63_00486 [Porcisia hertigi]
MHRASFFCAPYLRPIRRPGPKCRPVTATHMSFMAAATAASAASQLTGSRMFFDRVKSSGHGVETQTEDLVAATSLTSEGASVSASASANASSAQRAQISIPSSSEIPQKTPWTAEQVYSILRRHESLCDRIPLLSSASLSMGLVTSLLPADAKTTLESLQSVHHSSHGMPPRSGPRASAEAVREVRVLLDRLAQDPEPLSALHEKQRHRLVTEACRLGYAVGLYSRCCALYVNMVLLARGTSVGGRDKQPAASSGTSLPHESVVEYPRVPLSTVASGDTSPTPDFIIDAAGETADLTTLHMCLLRDTHASLTEANITVTPRSLTALHVYAQCVRALLRHGWGGFLTSKATNDGVCTSGLDAGDPRESKDVEDIQIDPAIRTTEATHDASNTAADPALPTPRALLETAAVETSGQQRWHDFALTVLHHLRIDDDDVEDFLRTSLWKASYRNADTGGDWGAAQSCVYAQVFRYWLKEEEVLANHYSAPQRPPQHDRKVESETGGKRRESAPVLLTVPALVTLLRTAVVARQHDVAEWATLCVDACLEEWIRDSKTTVSNTDKDTQHCSLGPADHRIAAPLSSLNTPSAQVLPQLDTLLSLYLRYLQQSSQQSRAVRWLSRLRRRQHTVPILSGALGTLSVAREAARLASDELDGDLAMWCLQLCLSDTTSSLPPGHADIFQCLCAYARCGLPNFDVVLQSLLKNELLSPTPEEILFLRLLHARRSVNWRTEWEQCVAPYITEEEEVPEVNGGCGEVKTGGEVQGGADTIRPPPSRIVRLQVRESKPLCKDAPSALPLYIGEDQSLDDSGGSRMPSSEGQMLSVQHPPMLSSVFSSRVIYQALLILQEGEHPAFMSYYRTFLLTFSDHITPQVRARWVVLAIMWAIQLQGSARSEDVVYIAREVEQLTQLQQACTHAATAATATTAPPHLPPFSTELWHSLGRKWTALYQQYPLSLWKRAATVQTDSTSDPHHNHSSRQLLCTPSAAALATTPVLTRFSKRRHLLPSAVIPATELLRTSRHSNAALAYAGKRIDGDAAAAHWLPPDYMDLNLWVNYVEASQQF